MVAEKWRRKLSELVTVLQIIGFVFTGLVINLETALLFEPVKDKLCLQPFIAENPRAFIQILQSNYLLLITIPILFLFDLRERMPKKTFKECMDFENFSGCRLNYAWWASLSVSEKSIYELKSS